MLRYFSYRLYPSRAQVRRLEATLAVCGRFFNHLLAERLTGHHEKRTVGLVHQLRQVAVFRSADAEAALVHSHTLQLIAKDADRAWRAWIRHGAKGNGPRPRQNWDARSFGFKQPNNGWKVDGRRLRLFKIGRVASRWHRPLLGTLKTLRVYRQAGRWFAAFGCEVEPTPLAPTGREVGLDLGTEHLATLSTGERIPNPRLGLAAQGRLTILRERLKRAVPGSPGHRKAMIRLGRAQIRVAAQRRDHLSKVVAGLVGEYDRIAIEAFNASSLSRRRAAVSDAGWGLFRRLLVAKAKATGRVVTPVNPVWSSQTCSACGRRSRRRLPLSEREFVCDGCGYRADRDTNAALVILGRARERWGIM